MKKYLFLAMLFLGGISQSVHARSKPTLKFKEGSSHIILLKASAVNNAIQVVFQNGQGELLFTETLAKGYSYRKNYNLSDFSDGVFYVKIVEAKNVQFFQVEKGEKNKITEIDKLPFE